MTGTMNVIAVLGSGNIGATLARKWAAAGHIIVFGTRDQAQPALRGLADEIGATVASHRDAVAGADVVVFALPGDAMETVVEALGAALDGKLVIDATNNLTGPHMSSVATIRAAAPGAVVSRAFNSVGWENFADPDFDGVAADLLWCGPDGASGSSVERLIADVGLRPVRVGGLDRLVLVNTMASLWFALAFGQGRGRHLAFKVLTRQTS